MDRSKVITLALGLAACVLLAGLGVLMKKGWVDVTVGASLQGFLAFVLFTVRSWLPTPTPDVDAKLKDGAP